MTDHTIDTTRDEGVVLLVQLNRPEVREALDEHMHAVKGA
jgi:enoyl-CoA hydratase/carnithine racemase